MTKRLKTTLLVFCTAVLILMTCLLTFPQFSVFADKPVESPTVNLDDSIGANGEIGNGNYNFYISPGASIYDYTSSGVEGADEGFADGVFALKYRIGLKASSLKHANLLNYSDYINNWRNPKKNSLANTYYEYKFTVYREVDADTSYALEEITVRIDYVGSVSNPRLRKIILRKPLAVKSESLDVGYGFIPIQEEYPVHYAKEIRAYPYYSPDMSYGYGENVAEKWADYVSKGYEVLYWGEMSDGGLFANYNEKYGYFAELVLDVQSPLQKYFIKFEYKYNLLKEDRTWRDDVYHTPNSAKGGCVSEHRSIREILIKAEELDELENLLSDFGEGSLEVADGIINNVEKKEIRLRYLKQIKGTPFAEMVEERVTLNVVDGDTIYLDDIAEIMGKETLECLNSYAKTPKYNEDGNYFYLEYLDTVWLRCLTEDGNFKDFYFDINLSFKQTYDRFVKDGVLPNGLYEYLFNQMKLAYVDKNGVSLLAEKSFEDVYGYFGFVVAPETNSLNTAFHDMFGDGTKTTGVLGYFESETSTLNSKQYNALLQEYGYSWLDKLWAGIFSNAEDLTNKSATYHLFYCDAYDRTDAVLGKGGQEKPSDGGAIDNAVGGMLEDVGDFIGGAWDDVMGGANTLWDTLMTPFKSSINIVAFALVAVIVVVVAKKLGFKMPKRSGGSKKKKK